MGSGGDATRKIYNQVFIITFSYVKRKLRAIILGASIKKSGGYCFSFLSSYFPEGLRIIEITLSGALSNLSYMHLPAALNLHLMHKWRSVLDG